MAVTWGAWEYASGNGMRLGYSYAWTANTGGAITSTTAKARITLTIYTEVQYNYSGDTQTITYSGDASGTTNFTNSQASGTVVNRGDLVYDYPYATSSYDTSPGNKTYGGTLSGTYNGVTPSFSTGSIAIPARPSQAPTAPTSVSATPNNGSISVSFAAPTTAGSGGVDYYQKSSNNSTWSTATNPFTISGTNGTLTTGYVRAVSVYGGAGPSASASATPRTVPTAPTSFAANTDTFGQIGLSWAVPSSNGGASISGYRLRTGTTLGAGTLLYEGTGTSYTHTSLSPYTDYSYNIVAYNVAGESTDTTNATLTAKTMGGIARVWNGTSWVTVLPKVWNGTAWVTAQARMYDNIGATEELKWKHGI